MYLTESSMEPICNPDLPNELIWDILYYLLPEPSGYTTVSTLCLGYKIEFNFFYLYQSTFLRQYNES